MVKNKKKNNFLKICCVILAILTLIFISLYISANTENNFLKEKANVLDEILNYQKIALNHAARAQEIQANLDDYFEQWGGEEVGSASEQRYLERYKEELDKFKLIVEEDNKFARDHSDLLSNYLGVNAEEIVSSNNLAYTVNEDDYYLMINYVE